MGYAVRKMLGTAVAVTFFIAAVSIAIILFRDISRGLDTSFITNTSEDRTIYSGFKASDARQIDGAFVLQSIYDIKAIGADIKVDGVLYPKTLEIENADTTGIDVKNMYKEHYIRDIKGNLIEIRYILT